ncbi:MAG: YraN family protein [Candidatus Hydrogenedentes bacterium]|nr:YraN family protein [Candidatus Hydrogenedentota bacterium]
MTRADVWVRGEDAAARYLKKRRYKILARNVRCGRNEIDIIARTGDTVVFVEVRTRMQEDGILPEDTVTATKQAHLRAAARWYLARNQEPDTYYRFDVVAIILPPQGNPRITHYESAF